MLWWSKWYAKIQFNETTPFRKPRNDNDEFCNKTITTRAAGRREKQKKEDNLRTIQVVERAERASKGHKKPPRRQVGKISEENPFSPSTLTPPQKAIFKGRILKGGLIPTPLRRGWDLTPIK
jgi:hypothetical protein